MLIGLGGQQVATIPDLLVRNLYVTEWQINLTKIQGLSITGKFLGIQLCEACQGER